MAEVIDIHILKLRRQLESAVRQKRERSAAAQTNGAIVPPKGAGRPGAPPKMSPELVNLAMEFAAIEGPEELSLREIAGRLGVAKSTLHEYGVTKTEARRRASLEKRRGEDGKV